LDRESNRGALPELAGSQRFWKRGLFTGYELARRIEQQTKGALAPFTLAGLSTPMSCIPHGAANAGFVAAGKTGSNGPGRRRCYRLTAEGKKKVSPIRQGMGGAVPRLCGRLTKVPHG